MSLKKTKILGIMSIISLFLVGCNSTQSKNTVIEGNPREILANKDARQAMHLVLDKEEMQKCNDFGFIPEGFLTKGIYKDSNENDYRDFTEDISFIYDIDEAQKKWNKVKKEIGFTNTTIKMKVITDDGTKDSISDIYREIEKQLEQLEGLDIELTPVTPQEYTLDSDIELSILTLEAVTPVADAALNSFRGDIGYMSLFNYKNDLFSDLLDKAGESSTIQEKWKYCFDAERNLIEDAIVYPIYQFKRERLKKSYVKGNELFQTGVYSSYRKAYLTNGSKTIRIGRYYLGPVVCDTVLGSNNTHYDMLYETMDGLVRLNEDNVIENVLAESWESSNEGKTWTFKLVKDAKWHNGDPVVADDFVYAVRRALNPEIKSVMASMLMLDIEGAEAYYNGEEKDASTIGVRALDDYTLEFELKKPVHEFLNFVSTPIYYPQNQKFIEKCGEKYGTSVDTMLFNGPFKLEAIDESKTNYTLVKNKDYRKADEIKLDKMIIINNETPEKALESFKNNELDIIINSPNSALTEYMNSEEFKKESEVQTTMSGKMFLLLFNPVNNIENKDTESKE